MEATAHRVDEELELRRGHVAVLVRGDMLRRADRSEGVDARLRSRARLDRAVLHSDRSNMRNGLAVRLGQLCAVNERNAQRIQRARLAGARAFRHGKRCYDRLAQALEGAGTRVRGDELADGVANDLLVVG